MISFRFLPLFYSTVAILATGGILRFIICRCPFLVGQPYIWRWR